MDQDILTTGQATAEAWYKLMLAPLGKELGSLGDLVVQSAAEGCSQTKNDPLAAQFSRLLQAEAK